MEIPRKNGAKKEVCRSPSRARDQHFADSRRRRPHWQTRCGQCHVLLVQVASEESTYATHASVKSEIMNQIMSKFPNARIGLRLLKSLYGLKNAPMYWNVRYRSTVGTYRRYLRYLRYGTDPNYTAVPTVGLCVRSPLTARICRSTCLAARPTSGSEPPTATAAI